MKAKEGKKYALVSQGDFTVTDIFTIDDLKQWDENSILMIELSKEQEKWVKIGTNYDIATQALIKPDLSELKNKKLDYINMCFERECQTIKGEYTPSDEILTWQEQESEAKAFLSGNDATKAPMLNILAQKRGIHLKALATKVLEKSNLYRQAISLLVGHRQQLQDLVENAQNEKELDKIKYISPMLEN